jgi:cell wall-associated NlpC family hydrolase
MSMEWINDYIGKPYQLSARGPGAYDCWGLVMAVYREQLGVALPDWNVPGDAALREVVQAVTDGHAEFTAAAMPVDVPRDFDLFAASRSRMPHHVGLYIGGGVLHTQTNTGAVWEPLPRFNHTYPNARWWRCRT